MARKRHMNEGARRMLREIAVSTIAADRAGVPDHRLTPTGLQPGRDALAGARQDAEAPGQAFLRQAVVFIFTIVYGLILIPISP